MSLGYSGLIMMRYLLLLSLLLAAPAFAQVRAPHHSAGESCRAEAPLIATTREAEKVVPTAQAEPEPAAAGANSCAQCEHHYRMPPRWHSFLPGMYR